MLSQVVLVIFLASANCDTFRNTLDDYSKENRLPNNTKPISYDLHIITNIHLSNFDYNGSVLIEIKALQDTNVIVLHAGFNLNILKINLVDIETGEEFKNLHSKRHKINEFFIIFSESEQLQLRLHKRYILSLAFNSTLEDSGFAFYKSRSFLGNNQTEEIWIASTFFEPFYARFVFPCYDEPQLKAQFKISITHGRNYTALSNTPIDSKILKSNEYLVTTKFKETPQMSTYTVAFFIGVVDKISMDIDNITTNVYSPRGIPLKGEYSLDVGAKSLNALERYLEVKYPLTKLDHISVQELPANAMENWGLIIYDVQSLLREPGNKERDTKGAIVVAHEITHQWFGNLLTPKWWHNIWLSEGITTFYSLKILDMVYPEMKAYEFYLFMKARHLWNGFEDRSMTFYNENKNTIWDNFQSLFYWKGSYIMRMFEHAIGESTFKKGITKYLQRYQYSSVEQNDLFEVLQEVATEDNIPEFENNGTVAKMMSSWTDQLHYPILQVGRDPLTNNIIMTQRPVKNLNSNDDLRFWWIPITMATASSPDFNKTRPNFIFSANNRTIRINPSDFGIKFDGENDWLILNNQVIGLYRVLYDDSNYHKIVEALKKDKTSIHSYNKAQLLRDAFYFVGENKLSHSVLFKLYECLEDDLDIIAWNELLLDFYFLQKKMEPSGGSYYFNYFFSRISKNILEHVGTEGRPNDTAFIQVFRRRLLQARCHADISNCNTLYKVRS